MSAYPVASAMEDERLAKERAAWARMVLAVATQERWLQKDPAGAEARAAVVERAAARRALMELGVDYDALLAAHLAP